MPSTLQRFLAKLDPLHSHTARPSYEKRELYGHVFGTELPAFIIFHAMLGYVLLAIGLGALALRLPFEVIRRKRWLHKPLGYTWIFGTVWMPVTTIWCIYEYFGWNVVAFFIYSMFAAIQVGWVFIQVYKQRKDQLEDIAASTKHKACKVFYVLHALCMVYSVIMLLGAGVSFPFRAYARDGAVYRKHDT